MEAQQGHHSLTRQIVPKSQHLQGRRKNNTSPTRRFVLIIIISPRPTIASEAERDANFRPYAAPSTIITAYKVGPDQCEPRPERQ